MRPNELIEKADLLVHEEKVEEAISLLKSLLLDHDKPRFWVKLARAYQILGEDVLARAILRNVVLSFDVPSITDIIAAQMPYCVPIVLDDAKLLYYYVPKSGSTSIKNAILAAIGQTAPTGKIHVTAHKLTRAISFEAIDRDYYNYTSIAVIRPPIERFRSYWTNNVVGRKELFNEAGGRTSYYGLKTMPGYIDALHNFRRYRQVFHTFRVHTDSVVGFIGDKRARVNNLFELSNVDDAIRLICQTCGADIAPVHLNEASAPKTLPPNTELEDEIANDFYRKELALYFSY